MSVILVLSKRSFKSNGRWRMFSPESLVKKAIECGMTQGKALNMGALVFMPEVRDMCSADRCRSYGKNWCCPPACGTLEEASERIKGYSSGIILQTVGNMEDEFDYETIEDTAKRHKSGFAAFVKELKKDFTDILPMGAGTCTICKECTYPDAPCRNPDDAIISMEAYGLWVSRVCEMSDIPYNNGKNTITYTSCCLFK